MCEARLLEGLHGEARDEMRLLLRDPAAHGRLLAAREAAEAQREIEDLISAAVELGGEVG